MAPIAFRDVDLDLKGDDLGELVQSLKRKAILLNHTKSTAAFELSEQAPDPDTAIRRFCAIINALPSRERTVWDTCILRRFSIGISTGSEPYSLHWIISTDTLKLVTQLHAEIEISVYSVELPQT